MTVLTLFGNRTLRVSDSEGRQVDEALGRNPRPKYITVKGQRIHSDQITGIFTQDQWDIMEHERLGDYKCGHGYWHGKTEGCGHAAVSVMPDHPKGTMAEWKYAALQMNYAILRNGGSKSDFITTKEQYIKALNKTQKEADDGIDEPIQEAVNQPYVLDRVGGRPELNGK